jgi:hypothetical protein
MRTLPRRTVSAALPGISKGRRALGQPTNDILDRAIDDLKDAVDLDPTSKTNADALGEAYLVKWYQRDAQVHEDLQLREQPDPRTGNIYAGRRGWANAYYLADHGERIACVLYPPAGGCASKEGR